MTIPRRTLAACATALTAAGALTATPPAGATTAPAAARAAVTDIRELVNQRAEEVWLSSGEGGKSFMADPNGRATGSMWVPWVGNEGETGKSIAVHQGFRVPYWIFQDYWNTTDEVRYSTTNSYRQSLPVPGGTGGGRKRLVIGGDGSPSMENIS